MQYDHGRTIQNWFVCRNQEERKIKEINPHHLKGSQAEVLFLSLINHKVLRGRWEEGEGAEEISANSSFYTTVIVVRSKSPF